MNDGNKSMDKDFDGCEKCVFNVGDQTKIGLRGTALGQEALTRRGRTWAWAADGIFWHEILGAGLVTVLEWAPEAKHATPWSDRGAGDGTRCVRKKGTTRNW